MARPGPGKGDRWETRVLAFLEHPVNLVLANLVWFVLALPVVTWFAAAVALAHGLDGWFRNGDDRMVRNTLAGFRATWRRTLPYGIVSGLVAAVLAANALFLSTRPAGIATVLLGGTGALGVLWLAVHLWLVPVLGRHPDLPLRDALATAAGAAVRQAPMTLLLVVFTVLIVAVMVVFWTFVPFFAAAPVVALALRALDRAERT